MSQDLGRILVYGGAGALGTACVSYFKANSWWVASIDLKENFDADFNLAVEKSDSFLQQHSKVLEAVGSVLKKEKLDAIICVAGGWTGGDATTDLAKNADLMWGQSVWTSVISASIAAQHLKAGGLLTLPGANVALEKTPKMIGYGMAKAAVHHLTRSLGSEKSGLPAGSTCIAILPITLDTPENRLGMHDDNLSTWTPLNFVAELFLNWINGKERPNNGSLIQLVTKNFETELSTV